MHARGGSQWQKRRENSIGPLRRAHPASGATWNVQVVRGKMSTRCLWHACRALVLGIILMLVGAGMATVGYYANDFALGEPRNHTGAVRIKNEQRGLHLNNLSYVGPIIMGVGGFIVVASCVMTFEARDSAAKVVPARFKLSGQRNNNNASRGTGMRRTTCVQTANENRKVTAVNQQNRWDHQMGLFKTSPATEYISSSTDRQALTAALVHFSKTLGSPKISSVIPKKARRISKSGSFPNLTDNPTIPLLFKGSPNTAKRLVKHHRPRHSSVVQRSTRENGYLHPGMLRFHRHALSVDEGGPYMRHLLDSSHGSQGSVTLDPHSMNINDVLQKKRERTKRSETAKRHILSRQMQIEEHHCSPVKNMNDRRHSSTMSEHSASSRRTRSRRASSTSRTYSFDSRCTQPPEELTYDMNELEHSPEIHRTQSPRKINSVISTPSVEKEFRSQLSICSEPTVTVRNLSCQSSIEPCVPEEESPDSDDKEKEKFFTPQTFASSPVVESVQVTIESHQRLDQESPKTSRPDSLILNTTNIDNNLISEATESKQQKYLYRSLSTRSFKKPKPKPSKLLSNDLDRIFVISSQDNDDYYDSIEVISERRSKNFSKFYETEIEKEKEKEIDGKDVNIEIDIN